MEGWKTALDNHRPVLRESAHERSDPSRYAGNDFGHADLRHHWLAGAALRAARAGRGVLALRIRFRRPAGRLCRAGLPAPRQPGARGVPAGAPQRVFIVGNWVLLFASYSRASIAIGTAVYNVQPFMLVGLGAAFLGEKVTARKLGWLGLSFAGMLAIVSAHGDSDARAGLPVRYPLGARCRAAVCLCRADREAPARHAAASYRVDPGGHRRADARTAGEPCRTAPGRCSLGQPGDPGNRPYRADVRAALRRHSEIVDGADRCVVLHLSGRGDPGGLAGLRTSPEPGAVAWRGRHPACRGGHAAGLERCACRGRQCGAAEAAGKEKARDGGGAFLQRSRPISCRRP